MTIAEWIGTAVMLAVPYLVVGVLWSLTHPGVLDPVVAGAVGFDGVLGMTR